MPGYPKQPVNLKLGTARFSHAFWSCVILLPKNGTRQLAFAACPKKPLPTHLVKNLRVCGHILVGIYCFPGVGKIAQPREL